MKTFDIPNSTIKISPKSLTNYFNVRLKDGKWNLLANRTLTILGSDRAYPEMYDSHRWSEHDQWSTLAYRAYGTTDLWWAICKFNGINNPVLSPLPGSLVKIPKMEVINQILKQIKSG